MTSPNAPSSPPRSGRLSRVSGGGSRRASDPEARFTRNVTLSFVVLIAATAIILVIALLYGFWEGNLKPVASVGGAEISRSDWNDRQRLETFRADRADAATRAALAAGEVDEEVADRRFTDTTNARAAGAAAVMSRLVDLVFQGQLAAERDLTLSQDELEAVVEEDGSFPEVRRIAALVIQPVGAATGQATGDDRATARARAEEALAALRSGTPIAELVDEYSPATAANGGDLGFGSLELLLQGIDAVWADALFALDEGGISDIVESETGDLLIGMVTAISPEQPDPGFRPAVASDVGDVVHRRNVELEAIAAKLEAQVVADALATEHEQVRLAEVLIAGDPNVAPEDDEGTVRASHILYQPDASPSPDASASPAASAEPSASASPSASAEPAAIAEPAASSSPAASAEPSASASPAASAEPSASASPSASAEPAASAKPGESPSPEDDPALEAARVRAEATAAELRAIADVDARMAAFAEKAAIDGTDSTAQNGGDLGFFRRGDMVPEFADPIFDAVDPQRGDIIGPVRSQFGWHVIMYDEARAPIAERLAEVEEALAADGADFAEVASRLSDGATAATGGETGWHVIDDLDAATQLALEATEVGEDSAPVRGEAGYLIYRKLEEALRPLDAAAALRTAVTAFDDWYQERRFEAEDAGVISIDTSVYDDAGTTLGG